VTVAPVGIFALQNDASADWPFEFVEKIVGGWKGEPLAAENHSSQQVLLSSIVRAALYYGAYKSSQREENLALLRQFFGAFLTAHMWRITSVSFVVHPICRACCSDIFETLMELGGGGPAGCKRRLTPL